jgi:predicted AAA+ superfamily ATPase
MTVDPVLSRWAESVWRKKLSAPYVHLVFGARQTGKSTLLRALLPPNTVVVDLSLPRTRSRYLADPERLVDECRALPRREGPTCVLVDEAQSVPPLFDAVQHLYDSDRTRWRFVLCGSSARKLRRTGANLLPGRSFLHRLFPLILAERAPDPCRIHDADSPVSLPWPERGGPARAFAPADLATRLAFGELPGIVTADRAHRVDLLESYASLHLEEEMRREAMVRDWSAFVRFLRFAAVESGGMVNYAKIAKEVGLSVPTVKSHYQLLEDMFIGFRIPAFSRSRRKNLLSTDRFCFFDLGIRHAAAGLEPSVAMVMGNPGPLLEQWVGIELWKRLQYLGGGRLHYQRTKDGAEVDFVVEREGAYVPIEVKWTERPTLTDARHLLTFLGEHRRQARRGYVICRCERPLALHDNVTALPWSCL